MKTLSETIREMRRLLDEQIGVVASNGVTLSVEAILWQHKRDDGKRPANKCEFQFSVHHYSLTGRCKTATRDSTDAVLQFFEINVLPKIVAAEHAQCDHRGEAISDKIGRDVDALTADCLTHRDALAEVSQ